MTSQRDAAPTSLDRHIGIALAKLSSALRNHAWQDGLARGLTPTQGQILAVLEGRPAASLGEVAEILGVRAATASDAVGSLVEKGFVTKDRDAADRRILRLALTARGRSVAREAAQWPDFLGATVESLSAEDQRSFLRVLLGIIRQLQASGRIPVARMCIDCKYFRPFVHDDPAKPHHCAFVDSPFGELALRIECPDHQTAPPDRQAAAWDRLNQPRSP